MMLLLLFSSLCQASESIPTPEMFAYGVELKAAGNNAFYEVEIPLEIYKVVTRKDLGDIRIFNSNGEVVPHAMRKPANRTYKTETELTELPFFPLAVERGRMLNDLEIHVEKNAEGTIVDVKTSSQPQTAPQMQRNKSQRRILMGGGAEYGAGARPRRSQRVAVGLGSPSDIDHPQRSLGSLATLTPSTKRNSQSYLLDASSLKNKSIYALELEWADNQDDFMGTINVDSSHNLQQWHRSGTATIARFGYQGNRLDRNRITLKRSTTPYLRLTWSQGKTPSQLIRIRALTQETRTEYLPVKKTIKIMTSPVPGKAGEYRVDLEGNLPVDSVKILLQGRNTFANGTLYSADSADNGTKKEHWRGLLYNIDYLGRSVYNDSTTIRKPRHRYWTLVLEENENSIHIPPSIEFSWQPDRILFLAQGEGPFQLAYGSSEITAANFQIDSLLAKYHEISGNTTPPRGILPGPQFQLGGPNCLRVASLPLPWRKYILWSILFAGVLMIGWMSVSLYRQLQNPGE